MCRNSGGQRGIVDAEYFKYILTHRNIPQCLPVRDVNLIFLQLNKLIKVTVILYLTNVIIQGFFQQAGASVDMSRSIEEDSLVDGPLISADALHSAIRREFQTVPTPCHAGLLSLLHV